MSAYLLAEEKALGGEDCEAISGCAFSRAVCTGCLADFSLFLLAQRKESENGLCSRGHKKSLLEAFLTGRPLQASPMTLVRTQKMKSQPWAFLTVEAADLLCRPRIP
jgi:hypothetical protein